MLPDSRMRHCLRCRNSHREHGEDSLKFSAEGVAPPASFVRWRAFSPAFIVRACRTIPLSPERAAPAGLRGGSSMGYPRDRCRNTRRGSAEPNCIHSPGCRVRMGVYTNPGSSPAGTCCPPCRWTPTLPAALRHSGHAGAPCSCLRKRIRRGIWRPHGGGLVLEYQPNAVSRPDFVALEVRAAGEHVGSAVVFPVLPGIRDGSVGQP